ncbi:hypothetical protein KY285_036334 [Solanum tuberosum]|nr:hypothetical protein KY285_036334 [Solanum tuberosum]
MPQKVTSNYPLIDVAALSAMLLDSSPPAGVSDVAAALDFLPPISTARDHPCVCEPTPSPDPSVVLTGDGSPSLNHDLQCTVGQPGDNNLNPKPYHPSLGGVGWDVNGDGNIQQSPLDDEYVPCADELPKSNHALLPHTYLGNPLFHPPCSPFHSWKPRFSTQSLGTSRTWTSSTTTGCYKGRHWVWLRLCQIQLQPDQWQAEELKQLPTLPYHPKGGNRPDFRRNFRSLLDWRRPPLVVLLEIKMQSHQILLDDFPFNQMIKVSTICNSDGLVVLWDDIILELDEIATTGQEIHAMIKHNQSQIPPMVNGPTTIKLEDHPFLSSIPTMEEIKATIYSYHPFKASGPNGLHPFFYQKYWDTVGPSVFNLCQQAFREGTILGPINSTHLCLIYKCKNATSLKNFCPISLCNTSYKIITKTISRRLRPFMNKLIDPCQTSFLKNRQVVDNTIII